MSAMPLNVIRLTATAVVGLLAWNGVAAQSSTTPPEIASALTDVAHFTSDDIALLEAGQVIVRTETFPDLLEASVVAAVRINSQKDRTLAYFKTLVSYVDGQVTTGYGTFARPPGETDLKSLTLDRGDLADLRHDRAALAGADRVGAMADRRAGGAVRLLQLARGEDRDGAAAGITFVDRDILGGSARNSWGLCCGEPGRFQTF